MRPTNPAPGCGLRSPAVLAAHVDGSAAPIAAPAEAMATTAATEGATAGAVGPPRAAAATAAGGPRQPAVTVAAVPAAVAQVPPGWTAQQSFCLQHTARQHRPARRRPTGFAAQPQAARRTWTPACPPGRRAPQPGRPSGCTTCWRLWMTAPKPQAQAAAIQGWPAQRRPARGLSWRLGRLPLRLLRRRARVVSMDRPPRSWLLVWLGTGPHDDCAK